MLPHGSVRAATAVQPAADPAPEPDRAHRPPLVVILGPTASGKTGLAIQVAQALGGEIVNADSRQIYRGMDIGTAKPTPDERAAAPHHLLDLVTPDQTYTLAEYQRAAYDTINALHGRGQLPLLVGGTGQYLTAVIDGWNIPEVPPNPDLRAELEALAREHGAEALHNRLREADPAAAARIDLRNVRRVIRALEVYLETGTPITVLQRKTSPPYRILQFGLTMPREQLYTRIDARVQRMVQDGLLAEVRRLLEAGYTWECPAMSGLGYLQWRPHLDGQMSQDDVITAICNETHAFARRQYTWFNGHDTGIRWLNINQIAPGDIIQQIQDWLSNEGI
jgi:tRNA dimethylallyltransferase